MHKNLYNIGLEHRNITGYSPFCHINELDEKYWKVSFSLPVVWRENRLVPVHPATFNDLGLNESQVADYVTVVPSSSFRTVYIPEANVFWKLPLLRKITRGIRDLSGNQLDRSVEAARALERAICPSFTFLKERLFYSDDPAFNFIERDSPMTRTFPLFYVVRSDRFSKQFIRTTIQNIIESWFFWASQDIYLEYHTQNILVDHEGNLIYRDLSDVRSWSTSLLRPSCFNQLVNQSELASLVFDRTVCDQNLNHFLRYKHFSAREVQDIRNAIEKVRSKFRVTLPNYSLDFSPEDASRTPIRKPITQWRSNPDRPPL